MATCTIACHRRDLAGAMFPAVRGDILPKAERAAICVAIPAWMEKSAPGAADAARTISRGILSRAQQQRLARLTGDDTKIAWLEPLRRRKKSEKELSAAELWAAHFELMTEAFRAPDFRPLGKPEIKEAKERLEAVGTEAQQLAIEIREVGEDAQLYGLWGLYRGQYHDEALANLPDRLPSIASTLDGLADFFRRAALHYKPEGPVPPVGKPKNRNALKTTVKDKIAETCRKHFKTEFSTTVARLANASLNCTDIDRNSVRGSRRKRPRD